VRDFSENDFSEEKLSQFLRLAKISQVLDTPHILRSLHIAEIQRRQIFYYFILTVRFSFSPGIWIIITFTPR